jgi:hypothetical protein
MNARSWICNALVAGLVALAGTGCGGGGESGHSKPTYKAPVDKAKFTYTDDPSTLAPGEPVEDWGLSYGEIETFAGKEFTVLKSDSITLPDPAGVKMLFELDGNRIKIPYVEVHVREFGTSTAPDVTFTPSVPLDVDLRPPVGQAQTLTASGDFTLGDPGDQTNHHVVDGQEITYTLVGDDETVETVLGPISHTQHYEIATDYEGIGVTGNVWYKPDLGIVGARLESASEPPLFSPYAFGLKDYSSEGWHGDDTYVVQRLGYVDPTTPEGMWKDVYLASKLPNGECGATKMKHQSMLVEYRWTDAARAQTDEMPPLDVEFTAGFGYFPHGDPLMIPFSLFGDEDGLNYWELYVNQAAKNDGLPDPFCFAIDALWDSTNTTVTPGPVQVAMRIDFKVWKSQ